MNSEESSIYNKLEETLEKYVRYNLYHLTHKDNLNDIVSYGLCSREMLEIDSFDFVDISDHSVQRRRINYHQYVPLFFADNTPMLYVTFDKYDEKVVLIEIDKKIILNPKLHIIISDGNIACSESKYLESFDINQRIEFLKKMDWNIINNQGGAFSREWKRIRSAEVLVYGKISNYYFCKVHCSEKFVHEVESIVEWIDIKTFGDLTKYGVKKFKRKYYY